MKQCKGCKRANGRYCQVFKEKPKKCWAHTTDPNWHKKVMADIKKYKQYKNHEIGKYWR